MPGTPEELAYSEALRAIESQERMVNELRSRRGILLTGASIVTSLLGATALTAGKLGALGSIALVAFVLVVACCIWIVLPAARAGAFRSAQLSSLRTGRTSPAAAT